MIWPDSGVGTRCPPAVNVPFGQRPLVHVSLTIGVAPIAGDHTTQVPVKRQSLVVALQVATLTQPVRDGLVAGEDFLRSLPPFGAGARCVGAARS
jgi:hypothetical protein